jgi:hypothetical protein
VILNEFVEVTGYGRSYAWLVLRNHGRVLIYYFGRIYFQQ